MQTELELFMTIVFDLQTYEGKKCDNQKSSFSNEFLNVPNVFYLIYFQGTLFLIILMLVIEVSIVTLWL